MTTKKRKEFGDKDWICPRCKHGYEWIHDAFLCYPKLVYPSRDYCSQGIE